MSGVVDHKSKVFLDEEKFPSFVEALCHTDSSFTGSTNHSILPLQVQGSGGATVTEIMDTWTRQMGYPIFTVNQTTNTLTQTRFLAVQPEDPTSLVGSPYE